MTLDTLISPEYRAEQVLLHGRPNGYGGKGKKWATAVQAIAWTYDCRSLLDYGCGEGSLVTYLRAVNGTGALACKDFPPRITEYCEYDPAIEGKTELPAPADLVVCTDVLEHIEPEKIEAVLDHLCGLARKAVLVVVSLVETAKTLSNGRQAHILLREPAWWQAQFQTRGWAVREDIRHAVPEKQHKQWGAVLTP